MKTDCLLTLLVNISNELESKTSSTAMNKVTQPKTYFIQQDLICVQLSFVHTAASQFHTIHTYSLWKPIYEAFVLCTTKIQLCNWIDALLLRSSSPTISTYNSYALFSFLTAYLDMYHWPLCYTNVFFTTKWNHTEISSFYFRQKNTMENVDYPSKAWTWKQLEFRTICQLQPTNTD